MKIYRYEESEYIVNNINTPSIFLAGPTVRGNQPHLTSWRFDAIEEFKKQNYTGALIIPEFTSKTESDKSKTWVPLWEYNGLKKADCIMFWIPRTKELIALTTNMEFGYWQAREPQKLIYGRPDDAYRMSYLDIMWTQVASENNQYANNIYTTLEDTVKASIESAQNRFNKRVPQSIIDDMIWCKEFELNKQNDVVNENYLVRKNNVDNYFLKRTI